MTTKLIEVSTTKTGKYTDITDYITPGELNITPTKYAPKKGRAPINGAMYGGLIAEKTEIKANCQPLTQQQTQTLLPLIKPERVWVNYLDPEQGWRVGVEFLSGNRPSTALMVRKKNGAEITYWDGITFELSEV